LGSCKTSWSKLIAVVDAREIKAPAGIRFYVDNVTSPKLGIYSKADVIYSIRPPQELWNDIGDESKS